MNYLAPHSAEWFAAVDRYNPQQAAITRQIIQMAGRSDVCSICGDSPAMDYKVIGRQFDQDTGAKVRLCDDCREIQRSTNGESFIRM